MTRSWVCPAGHGGSERLSLPTCPACGLPVDYVPDAVPPIDETFVGNSQPKSVPASTGSFEDFIFPEEEAPDQTLERKSQTVPLPPPFFPIPRPPFASQGIDKTLDPQSRTSVPPPPRTD